MLPYWIMFSVFAAGALQNRQRNVANAYSAPLLAFAGFLVAILIGFRFKTGADWFNYINMFENVRYMDLWSSMEMGDPGYQFLNWLSLELGFEIWFVNVVCAAVFCWGLIRFARVQPNPWLAVLVAVPYLVLVVAMGYTRQGVAIGIIMAGLAAQQRSPSIVRFTIYVLFAATFHKTAVIILPLMLLTSERNRVTNGIFVLLAGYGLYKLFLQSSVDSLVTNYIDAEYSSQGAAIRVAMNLIPAAIFIRYQRRFGLPEDQRKLWLYFSIAAFVLLAALFVLSSTTVVDRLALYVIPLQLVVLSRLPDIFSLGGKRNGQLVLVVIAYSALVQFVWLNYANHSRYWLPYRFYPFFSSEEVVSETSWQE